MKVKTVPNALWVIAVLPILGIINQKQSMEGVSSLSCGVRVETNLCETEHDDLSSQEATLSELFVFQTFVVHSSAAKTDLQQMQIFVPVISVS